MLGFQVIYRKIKLAIVAPPEIEILRAERLQAVRAAERAKDDYDKRLARSRTITDEATARALLHEAQRKEQLAALALAVARESYLKSGIINVDDIRAKIASMNKAASMNKLSKSPNR